VTRMFRMADVVDSACGAWQADSSPVNSPRWGPVIQGFGPVAARRMLGFGVQRSYGPRAGECQLMIEAATQAARRK